MRLIANGISNITNIFPWRARAKILFAGQLPLFVGASAAAAACCCLFFDSSTCELFVLISFPLSCLVSSPTLLPTSGAFGSGLDGAACGSGLEGITSAFGVVGVAVSPHASFSVAVLCLETSSGSVC